MFEPKRSTPSDEQIGRYIMVKERTHRSHHKLEILAMPAAIVC
jgi:hypothetical protein